MIELGQIYKDFYLLDVQNNKIFLALCFLVIFDIILGHLKAWANDDFRSMRSRQGIVTHGCMLLALNFVYPILFFYEIDGLINSIMLLLCFSFAGSIVENYKALGGFVPKNIEEWLNKKKG